MTITDIDTEAALETLFQCVRDRLSVISNEEAVLIGIHTGGAWVAQSLADRLQKDIPMGTLDISFYRDDFSRIGINPEVRPSSIPCDIDDKHIILVDDVLYSGRTIRAALNEIFDYGRPASVTLAVLIERDGRQLPIAADCIGKKVSIRENQQIKLDGPEPLALEIVSL